MQKRQTIVPGFLAARASFGCDTVSACLGIGIGTVVRIPEAAPDSVTTLGNLDAPLSKVIK